MKGLITEMIATKKGLAIDNTDAIKETERVSLAEVSKIRFLVRLEVGVGTTFVATLKQHTLAAAGTTQDVISCLPTYSRVDGAVCVKAEPVLVAPVAIADLDLAAGFAMFEIDHSDLEDGFEFVSLELAAPGALRSSAVIIEIDSERKPAYELA